MVTGGIKRFANKYFRRNAKTYNVHVGNQVCKKNCIHPKA